MEGSEEEGGAGGTDDGGDVGKGGFAETFHTLKVLKQSLFALFAHALYFI
jgi:hypothetical protein